MEHWFDDLSRATAANRLSRRQVIAGIGGAMGAALVPLTASDAWANHIDCTTFCNQYPRAEGRNRCIHESAFHKGTCFECGPGASDPSRVFCHDRCCHAGEKCENNKCVPGDGGNQPCETFVCGFPSCATRSSNPADCFCFEVVGGASGVCLANFFCIPATPCPNGQSDCPAGETCVTNTCCGSGVQLCAPACPPAGTATRQLSLQSAVGGPTAGGN